MKKEIKKNKYIIPCAIELVLALFFIILILLPDREYSVDISGSRYSESSDTAAFSRNNSEMYRYVTEPVPLPMGRYFLKVNYECAETSTIIYVYNGAKVIQSISLTAENNIQSLETWFGRLSNPVSCTFLSNNAAPVKIDNIVFRRTDYIYYIGLITVMLLFTITCFAGLIDSGRICPTKEEAATALLLVGMIIISCIPLYNDVIYLGHDSRFHLDRIEGIKEGLLSGQFPVSIYPLINSGYGYATPLFYGDAFLYIPAVMRLMGFTLQFSFKAFIFMINAFSVIAFYFCVKKITCNRKYGLLGAFLFIFSTYHFSDTYGRASIGEITAWGFFPLIVVGLWNIYTMDVDDKRYSHQWIVPMIGYTGVIESHIISTELVAMATVLTCLVLFKRTFKLKRFLNLLKTASASIAVNMYFILPFLDSMKNENVVITRWKDIDCAMQANGIHLADLFRVDIPQMFLEVRFFREVYTGLGIAFGLGLLVIIYVFIRYKQKAVKNKPFIFFSSMAVFFTALCLTIFPWDGIISFLQNFMAGTRINQLTLYAANALANIQWPYRFLTIATVFFAIAIVLAISMLENRKVKYTVTSVIAFMLLGQYIWSSIGLMTTKDVVHLNSITRNDTEYANDIGMMEYYPMVGDTLTSINLNEQNCKTIFVDVSDYKKEYTNIYLHASNSSGAEGLIELPLFYYRGYVVENLTTHQLAQAEAGAIKNVSFKVPVGEYDYKIYYNGINYWYIGYYASLASVILLVFYTIYIFYNRNIDKKKK